MSDLIDRQDAIDAVKGRFSMPVDNLIAEVIGQLPSAQPERKTGRWIKENIVLTSDPPQYRWHCSECGRVVHGFTTGVLTDYCPNCGTKMRKGEQE